MLTLLHCLMVCAICLRCVYVYVYACVRSGVYVCNTACMCVVYSVCMRALLLLRYVI